MWLTVATGIIVALIGAYNARFGPRITRQTDIEKMCFDRLKTVEAEKQELEEQADELREQIHELRLEVLLLKGMRAELEKAEATIAAQKRLLKLWNPEPGDGEIIT